MIPRGLRFYFVSGADVGKAWDIRDYNAYLASKRDDSGPRASGKGSSRAQSSGAATERGKVGPAVGVYDPEWASWVAEESL